MIRASRAVLLMCILAALSFRHGVAQESTPGVDFELIGRINGGGGISAGGEFRVIGGIADIASGQSFGGDFAVTGGLVELFTVPMPQGDITLVIARTPAGIRISWPGEAEVTLEATTVLGPGATWQAIQTPDEQGSLELRLEQAARFFRMRRQ